ncbi:hypothetical protein [Leuconostoc falkenbergense]|uniref:hypothetical protein n=1 Tax=Leuconostoc falkenbergense TaxID=2766470 RepID=UPI0021AA1E09|nr:hypothetical protein [Leuconostoc falkenbergense]MCT4390668.1 hypothetical protein [Leuconostoc falkenbergense]
MKIIPKDIFEQIRIIDADIHFLTIMPYMGGNNVPQDVMKSVMNLLRKGNYSQAKTLLLNTKKFLNEDEQMKQLTNSEKESWRDDNYGNPGNISNSIDELIQKIKEYVDHMV